jgi:sugar phosphate isomerase/epimerase
MNSDSTLGVQTAVFAGRSLNEILDAAEAADIRHLELCDDHLSLADDPDTLASKKQRLHSADLTVCGFGVVDLTTSEDARDAVGFAADLGVDYLTVNYPPARDDITEALVEHAERFGVDVAVHNYSTVHHDDLSAVFSSIADVEDVLDRYSSSRFGVCVDTGHFLVMDNRPEDVLPALGDRVHAIHLKDTSNAAIEDVPGAGALDLSRVVDLLDAHVTADAPLIIEYELPHSRAPNALQQAKTDIEEALTQR